jgi:hypothetical protein
VNSDTPKTTAAAGPPGGAVEQPCEPLAPVTAQGDRRSPSPARGAETGLDVPGGAATNSGEGDGRSHLPGDPPALAGQAFRDRVKAVQSAQAAEQTLAKGRHRKRRSRFDSGLGFRRGGQ